jgi:drug/metabolite transporter (DMT)-like permease
VPPANAGVFLDSRDYRVTAANDRIAIAALLTGATVWGLIWYPYRVLAAAGVSGIASSTLTYAVALACALLLWRRSLHGLRPSWMLLAIALTAGGCNLGYVLATLHGEVMRVLLLFYLAPLWTVLLSRLLLGERLNGAGVAVVALSLAGAVTMLWHPELGAPFPAAGAEWIGLAAGFLFALSNVLVRKTPELSIEHKSVAVFVGVVVLGALLLPLAGGFDGAALARGQVLAMLALVGVVLLAVNLVVYFGLTQVPANRAIVIFLSELVVAAVSSGLLAGEAMGLKEWLGGAMIVGASLFSGKVAPERL